MACPPQSSTWLSYGNLQVTIHEGKDFRLCLGLGGMVEFGGSVIRWSLSTVDALLRITLLILRNGWKNIPGLHCIKVL
jgi:hypothetical protein